MDADGADDSDIVSDYEEDDGEEGGTDTTPGSTAGGTATEDQREVLSIGDVAYISFGSYKGEKGVIRSIRRDGRHDLMILDAEERMLLNVRTSLSGDRLVFVRKGNYSGKNPDHISNGTLSGFKRTADDNIKTVSASASAAVDGTASAAADDDDDDDDSIVSLDSSAIDNDDDEVKASDTLTFSPSATCDPDKDLKYVRIKAGVYAGSIGRMSSRRRNPFYSVRIVNPNGDTTYRHTTITANSITDLVYMTPAERKNLELDRARFKRRASSGSQGSSSPRSSRASTGGGGSSGGRDQKRSRKFPLPQPLQSNSRTSIATMSAAITVSESKEAEQATSPRSGMEDADADAEATNADAEEEDVEEEDADEEEEGNNSPILTGNPALTFTPSLTCDPTIGLKYVRLLNGIYAGSIGKISCRPILGRYSVRIMNMNGDTTYRHTNCRGNNMEDLADATPDEMAVLEVDRLKHTEISPRASSSSSYRYVNCTSSNLDSAGGVVARKLPASKKVCAEDYIGKYVRLRSGIYINRIGRVSTVREEPALLSISLLNLPGVPKLHRHTNIAPANVDENPQLSEAELQLVEADKSSRKSRGPVAEPQPLDFEEPSGGWKSMTGKKVRISSGVYADKLARCSTYYGNGTYSLLLFDELGERRHRHTTAKLNKFEIVEEEEGERVKSDPFFAGERVKSDPFLGEQKDVREQARLWAASAFAAAGQTNHGSSSEPQSNRSRVVNRSSSNNKGAAVSRKKKGEEELEEPQSDDDDEDGAEDGDESRNNLYWATGLQKPVLWYGDSTKTGNDLVEVLVICTSDAEAQEIAAGKEEDDKRQQQLQSNWPDTYKMFESLFPLLPLPMSQLKDFDWINGSSTGYDEGLADGERGWRTNSSSASGSATSATSSSGDSKKGEETTTAMEKDQEEEKEEEEDEQQEEGEKGESDKNMISEEKKIRVIPRGTLIPLDDDILNDNCKNEISAAFSGALMDFAEWDDHLRDSYVWPTGISKLLEHPTSLQAWIAETADHILGKHFVDIRKRFLFFLCANHLGVTHECEINLTGDLIGDDGEKPKFDYDSWKLGVPLSVEEKPERRESRARAAARKAKEAAENMAITVNLLRATIDLQSVVKDDIRCSQEVWTLLETVSKMTDNQSNEFIRYCSRFGENYQVPEIDGYEATDSIGDGDDGEETVVTSLTDVDTGRGSRKRTIDQHETQDIGLGSGSARKKAAALSSVTGEKLSIPRNDGQQQATSSKNEEEDQHGDDDSSSFLWSRMLETVELSSAATAAAAAAAGSIVIMGEDDLAAADTIEEKTQRLVDEYLARVRALAEEHTCPGQLVEAPLYHHHEEEKEKNHRSSYTANDNSPSSSSPSTGVNLLVPGGTNAATATVAIRGGSGAATRGTPGTDWAKDHKRGKIMTLCTVVVVTDRSDTAPPSEPPTKYAAGEPSTTYSESVESTSPRGDSSMSKKKKEEAVNDDENTISTESNVTSVSTASRYSSSSSNNSSSSSTVSKQLSFSVPLPDALSPNLKQNHNQDNEKEGDSSKPDKDKGGPVRRWVTVFDGGRHRRTVLLSSCRLLSAPEDWALEILHKSNYDFAAALQFVQGDLRARSTGDNSNLPKSVATASDAATGDDDDQLLPGGDTNVTAVVHPIVGSLGLWTAREVEIFVKEAKKYKLKMRKIWAKVNAKLEKEALASGTLTNNTRKTFKEIFGFYCYYFPGEMSLVPDECAEGAPVKRVQAQGVGERDDYFSPSSRRAHRILHGSSPPNNATSGDGGVDPSNADSSSSSSSSSAVVSVKANLFGTAVTDAAVAVTVAKPSRPAWTTKVTSKPNRWPQGLPLPQHHLYWLRGNEVPCLCMGLDAMGLRSRRYEGLMSVLMINCSTYHQEVTVSSGVLDPFDEKCKLKAEADDRSISFAFAMKDFAEWEMARLADSGTLRRADMRWYEYPKFIVAMLLHPPTWAAWRKQSERAARGRKETRRKTYFDSLVRDFLESQGGGFTGTVSTEEGADADAAAAAALTSKGLSDTVDPKKEDLESSASASAAASTNSTYGSRSCVRPVLLIDPVSTISGSGSARKSVSPSTSNIKDDAANRTHTQYPWDDTPLPRETPISDNNNNDSDDDDGDEEGKRKVGDDDDSSDSDDDGAGSGVKRPSETSSSNKKKQQQKPQSGSRSGSRSVSGSGKADRSRASSSQKEGGGGAGISNGDVSPRIAAFSSTSSSSSSSSSGVTAAPPSTVSVEKDLTLPPRPPSSSAAKAVLRVLPSPASPESDDEPINRLNMYWIDSAGLPGLYFDVPGKEMSEKFCVQPVCCATYHYKVFVSGNYVQPLTVERLQLCTDERTQDFSLALMDFAEWDDAGRPEDLDHQDTISSSEVTRGGGGLRQSTTTGEDGAKASSSSAAAGADGTPNKTRIAGAAAAAAGAGVGISGSPSGALGVAEEAEAEESPYYVWPDFIYDLVCKPREWVSWRKRAERGILGSKAERHSIGSATKGPVTAMTRREAYLEALKQDWIAELARLEEAEMMS